MREAEADSLPFFSAFAAYVLTLHDTQTKVVDCRRTAVSNVIGGGMGGFRCDGNASVTSSFYSISHHHIFLRSLSTARRRGE